MSRPMDLLDLLDLLAGAAGCLAGRLPPAGRPAVIAPALAELLAAIAEAVKRLSPDWTRRECFRVQAVPCFRPG